MLHTLTYLLANYEFVDQANSFTSHVTRHMLSAKVLNIGRYPYIKRYLIIWYMPFNIGIGVVNTVDILLIYLIFQYNVPGVFYFQYRKPLANTANIDSEM